MSLKPFRCCRATPSGVIYGNLHLRSQVLTLVWICRSTLEINSFLFRICYELLPITDNHMKRLLLTWISRMSYLNRLFYLSLTIFVKILYFPCEVLYYKSTYVNSMSINEPVLIFMLPSIKKRFSKSLIQLMNTKIIFFK